MQFILFFFMLGLSALIMLVLLAGDRLKGLQRILLPARCLGAALGIIGLLDLLHILPTGDFHGAYGVLGCAAGLESLFSWSISRQTDKPQTVLRFAAKLLAVLAVAEVTLFNLPSYKMLQPKYTETTLALRDCLSTGENRPQFHGDGSATISGDKEAILTFHQIGQPVGTIRLDITLDDETLEAVYSIDATDATQMLDFRGNVVQSTVVRRRTQSQYTLLELSGDIGALRFHLTPASGGSFTLNRIILNPMIPFYISWIRLFFLLLVPIWVFALFHSPCLRRAAQAEWSFTRAAAISMTVVLGLGAFLAMDYRIDHDWKTEFTINTGNQMTMELVDAFEQGQVSLLDEPPQWLAELENPYETVARPVNEYAWDHVYYNGKYYSYYGIAPVVLVFLPYHLLTGYYCSNITAIFLFALIGLAGLTALYLAFIRQWFPRLNVGMTLSGLAILQVLSGLWFSVGRPDFYEAAISSGFAALTWAVYFLFTGHILGKGQISLVRTGLSALLFATAVLCRPTLAVYSICAVLFFILAAFRFRRSGDNAPALRKKPRSVRANCILYLLTAAIPFAVLGGIQMVYNYVRFDSPFDFGIQYSLTINDFTRAEFHPTLSLVALYNFFLNPPIFQTTYPFIRSEFQYMDVCGYFYADFWTCSLTSGLLCLALPTAAYGLSGKALRRLPDRRTRLKMLLTIGLPCVVMPLVIVASVWESGYSVRYMLDFSWEVILGAYVIFFWFYLRLQNQQMRRYAEYFFAFSLVWALLVGGTQEFNQIFRYTSPQFLFPEIAYSMKQAFMLWK